MHPLAILLLAGKFVGDLVLLLSKWKNKEHKGVSEMFSNVLSVPADLKVRFGLV